MRNTHQQLARNAKTTTRDEHGQMFDLKSLREEIQHPDERRSKPARTAMYWLSRLATDRANEAQVPREAVWNEIFHTKRLQSDLQSSDERRRSLAHRVLVSVSSVVAIRQVMDSTEPMPIDIKVRAITLCVLAREKANEVARANGEPELAYPLN